MSDTSTSRSSNADAGRSADAGSRAPEVQAPTAPTAAVQKAKPAAMAAAVSEPAPETAPEPVEQRYTVAQWQEYAAELGANPHAIPGALADSEGDAFTEAEVREALAAFADRQAHPAPEPDPDAEQEEQP